MEKEEDQTESEVLEEEGDENEDEFDEYAKEPMVKVRNKEAIEVNDRKRNLTKASTNFSEAEQILELKDGHFFKTPYFRGIYYVQ